MSVGTCALGGPTVVQASSVKFTVEADGGCVRESLVPKAPVWRESAIDSQDQVFGTHNSRELHACLGEAETNFFDSTSACRIAISSFGMDLRLCATLSNRRWQSTDEPP
jgi:hypothetical protein